MAAAITSVYDDVGIGASAMAAVSIVFDGVIIAGSGVSDRLLCKSVRLLSNDATNVADGDKGLIGRCVAAVDTPRITAPTELGGEHGVGKMSATAAAAAAVAAVIAVVAVVAGVAVVAESPHCRVCFSMRARSIETLVLSMPCEGVV